MESAPILLEVFTTSKDESDALYQVNHLLTTPPDPYKELAKKVLPAPVIKMLRKLMG